MTDHKLQLAVKLALSNDWQASHNIVQALNSDTASWIHAVLHKIEGDVWNSQYWYAKTAGKKYDDFTDTTEELMLIQQNLTA